MDNTIQDQQHIRIIDLMRGIAALSVCFFHFATNSSYYGSYLPDTNVMKQVGSYGWVGVQMFFVISGFIIPFTLYKNKYHISNFITFIKKRWLRIEPPYIVTIFLIIANWAFNAWLWSYPLEIDWVRIVLHFFYLPQFLGYEWINEIFWTLAIEFQFYLFMALCFPLFVHKNKWLRITSLGLFAAVHVLYPDSRLLTSHSGLFIAGIIGFMNRFALLKHGEALVLLAADLLYVAYQYNYNWVIVSVTLLTVLLMTYVNTQRRIGHFTGKISYSLYLTHGLIGGNFLFFSMYINFVKEHEAVRMLMVPAAILLSVLFAWIFNKYVEGPSQALSHRIKYDKNTTEPVAPEVLLDMETTK